MRAIVLDAVNRTITATEIDGKLESLQQIVNGDIERALVLENGDDVFVNAEGLMHDTRDFFDIGAHQPFAGNGVLIGHDGDGNSAPAKSSVADIHKRVKWMDIQTVRLYVAMGRWK